jgi:hypothetical protein
MAPAQHRPATGGAGPPRVDSRLIAALAADLAGHYTVERVDSLLGPVAAAALHRESPLPAVRATAGRAEPSAVLTRLWVLGLPAARREVDAALPHTRAAGAEQLGLVAASGHQPDDEVRPLVDLRPYSSDDGSWWLASDVGELATSGPLPPDHVLGVGGASLTLARWVPRDPVLSALDVGTGCGVQAFHLAQHSKSVVATDTSARCLAYAAFNAALNAEEPGAFGGRSLDLRRGDLLEPVRGEKFDLDGEQPAVRHLATRPGLPDVRVPRRGSDR